MTRRPRHGHGGPARRPDATAARGPPGTCSPPCPSAAGWPPCSSALVGFPLLTVILTAGRGHVDLATALSSYLVLVVAVAATGGVWPATLAAIAGFLLSNYYFAPPIHTFTIADARDVLALVMFLVTAGRGQRAGRPVGPAHGRRRPGPGRRPHAGPGGRADGGTGGQPPARPAGGAGGGLPAGRRPPSSRPVGTALGRHRAHGRRAGPGGRRRLDGHGHGGRHPPTAPAAATAGPAPDRPRGPGPPRDRAWPPRTGTSWPPSPPSWPPCSRAPPPRRGGRGRLPGPGQPAAHRPAGRRQPRPAHPAGLDQGGVLEPPLRPARLRPRGASPPAPHHRRRGRPAEQPGREPPRHEPAPDRLGGRALHRPPSVGDLVDAGRGQPRAPGRRRHRRVGPRPAPASAPIPCCWSGPWPTWSTTPSSTPGAGAAGRGRARWPAGWTSGSSTADRASAARTATWSSARSSAWATPSNRVGVGLGLAVARGFVEAVGGELDARGHARAAAARWWSGSPGGRPAATRREPADTGRRPRRARPAAGRARDAGRPSPAPAP